MEKSDPPSNHNTGRLGEERALDWLQEHGYALIERNWRNSRVEIDLIMSKGPVLHFVEVKARTVPGLGMPEQKVGRSKIDHMKKAAEAYLHQFPNWTLIQFDIIAIQFDWQAQLVDLMLIEDVF